MLTRHSAVVSSSPLSRLRALREHLKSNSMEYVLGGALALSVGVMATAGVAEYIQEQEQQDMVMRMTEVHGLVPIALAQSIFYKALHDPTEAHLAQTVAQAVEGLRATRNAMDASYRAIRKDGAVMQQSLIIGEGLTALAPVLQAHPALWATAQQAMQEQLRYWDSMRLYRSTILIGKAITTTKDDFQDWPEGVARTAPMRQAFSMQPTASFGASMTF